MMAQFRALGFTGGVIIALIILSPAVYADEDFQSVLDRRVLEIPENDRAFSTPVKFIARDTNPGFKVEIRCSFTEARTALTHCAIFVSRGILKLGKMATLTALAHELSHFRAGHFRLAILGQRDQTLQRLRELEADKGGAAIFCRMGFDVNDFRDGLRMIQNAADNPRSLYHFSFEERIEFLKRFTCDKLISG